MEEFLARSNNRRARERSFSNARTDRAKIFDSMEHSKEAQPQETQSSIDVWSSNFQSFFDPSSTQKQGEASEDKVVAAKGQWRQKNGAGDKAAKTEVNSTVGRRRMPRFGSRRFSFRNPESASLADSDSKSCVTVYDPTYARSFNTMGERNASNFSMFNRKAANSKFDVKKISERTSCMPSKASLDYDLMRSSSLISNGSQDHPSENNKANHDTGLVLSSSLLGKGSEFKKTSSRLSRKSQDVGLIRSSSFVRSSSFISRGSKDLRLKKANSKTENTNTEDDEKKDNRTKKGTNIFRPRERSTKEAIDRFTFRRSPSSKRVPSHVSDADDSHSVSDISEYSSDDSYSDMTGFVSSYLASPCAAPCGPGDACDGSEVMEQPRKSTMIEEKNERLIIHPFGKARESLSRDESNGEPVAQETKSTMDFKKPNNSRKIALMQTLQRAKGRGREFREIEL